MNAFKPETSSRQSDALNTSSGASTSNGMRGERTATSKSRIELPAEPSSETIAGLVQKVGAPSIVEIEKLIGDLQTARSYLQSEGERIEQEMTRYAHLSDTASASVKIITESLGKWRKGNDAAGSAAAHDRQADAA